MSTHTLGLPKTDWTILCVFSIAIHLCLFSVLNKFSDLSLQLKEKSHQSTMVISTVQKKVKATPVPVIEQLIIATPPPVVKKKKAVPRVISKPLLPKVSEVPATAVHGLSAASFSQASESTTLVSATAGNSLMVEDVGLRLTPEEVPPAPTEIAPPDMVDQSLTAYLDLTTLVKPEYTREAMLARLVGIFAIDVHVDNNGNVLEAEFVERVGFGMEERIRTSILGAHFFPQRNGAGDKIETWVTIQFRLEMP